MTEEEIKARQAHAFDISNSIVPRLAADGLEEVDDGLPMQEFVKVAPLRTRIMAMPTSDVITICSNAEYACNKNMFHLDEEGTRRFLRDISDIRKIAVSKVRTANALWTITDAATKSPFMLQNKHSVMIFTEKWLADDAVRFYAENQLRTTFAVTEIPGNDIIRFLGDAAYVKGAQSFLINDGDYASLTARADEVIARPDFSDVPLIQRPVTNPELFRAIAELEQEACWQATYDGKEKVLNELENSMIAALADARLLVPVKGLGQALKKGGKIIIPSLSNGEILATPAFTDWNEFSKVYSKDEWGGWIWRLDDLISAPDGRIVINAGSLGFRMEKSNLQRIAGILHQDSEDAGKS